MTYLILFSFIMQKITPFLWFDKQAEEAARFYTGLFKNGSMGKVISYPDGSPDAKPGGEVLTLDFTIDGINIGAMNAGPIFTINPSVSFFVTCQSVEEVEKYWNVLIEGGKSLMEL